MAFISPTVTSSASFFREEAEILKLLSHCETRVEGDLDSITATGPGSPDNNKSGKAAAAAAAAATATRPAEFLEVAASAARVMAILETYQEQPAILDASLEAMITPIMRGFRGVVALYQEVNGPDDGDDGAAAAAAAAPTLTSSPLGGRFTTTRLVRLSRLLYTLCKVRGHKKVVRLFPHEVSDLEPVFHLLQAQDKDDHETWHARYCLLLWLSIIVIVPFDLQTIDSSRAGLSGSGPSLVDRLISVCKMYLRDSGPSRNAAALCLSKLLTRPDMEARHLSEFLIWANTVVTASVPTSTAAAAAAAAAAVAEEAAAVAAPTIKSNDKAGIHQGIFLSTGALETLVLIFKHGHRQQMEGRIPAVAECMSLAAQATTIGKSSTSQRKLTMKLSQRVGLQYLPPRVAKWRYQRGQRSLLDNLTQATSSVAPPAPAASATQLKLLEADEGSAGDSDSDSDSDSDDDDVPEETDAVIEILLCGLRDKDTVVRWSAAKGIGRITGRLPQDYADEVVEEVLKLLSDGESDGAWHGGCLALAELARRGLLLPVRLSEVVPLVCRAIVYDVRRGKHSIGSHVRDAACYVCWAFARAYEPSEMRPYVQELSRGMLTTALFDREVNCRRAASAAFQENVGRQGHENFPNGIGILTRADYFSLGNRTSAYVEIAPFVGTFSTYRHALVDHLTEIKIMHWDPALRVLSAKALGCFAALDPGYIVSNVLPKVVAGAMDRNDLLIRHGNAIATAALVRALAKVDMAPPLGDALLKDIRNLVPRLEKARLYRGRGGEIMRGAACRVIEAIALARHPLTRRAQMRLLDTIDECVKHPTVAISEAAADALAALSRQYFPSGTDSQADEERMPLKYCKRLQTDDNPGARRGFALALGALPLKLVAPNKAMASNVLQTLVASADPKRNALSKGASDAETRRNAVASLGRISSILLPSDMCTDEQALQLFEMVLLGTEDYETDSRGAVGSWVRRAALKALPVVLRSLRLREVSQSGGVGSDDARAGAAYPLCTPERIERTICAILCQICGKIDVVRESAGAALDSILASHDPVIPCVPLRAKLEALLKVIRSTQSPALSGAVSLAGWGIPSVVFPVVVPLLNLDPFRTAIISGMKESIGDINESSAKSARSALLSWAGKERSNESFRLLMSVAESLLSVVMRRKAREFEAIMKTAALLLENGAFDFMDPSKSTFCEELLGAARSTMFRTREHFRAIAGMHVCCALTAFAEPISGQALTSVLLLLSHAYPVVRKAAADKLYSALLQYDIAALPEDNDETVDEMSDILLETPWAECSIATAREGRDSLFAVLGKEVPLESACDLMAGDVMREQKSKNEKDELSEYSALVREMHG